jgi:ABC-2 type transport system permease protein
MLVAFTAVCFAFLGMGLVIAMLAGAVPAVQALGQAIFLPMIMIGGVGVPLRALPPWAQHVAGYLPGRYAVEALDACYLPGGAGLGGSKFALAALVVIGVAACVAGARMFRWDAGQKLGPRARPWIIFALAAWAAVGLAAEWSGRLAAPIDRPQPAAIEPARPIAASATPLASPSPAAIATRWEDVTPAEINAVSFDDLPRDDGDVAPIIGSLAEVPADSKAGVDAIAKHLEEWPPAQEPDVVQRVRNLLSVATVYDILEDPDEGAVGYLVIDSIRKQAGPEDLEKILTYIIEHPNEGAVITKAPEFGIQGAIAEDAARARSAMYATKLLKRLSRK